MKRSFLTGLAVTVMVVQACGSGDGKRKVAANDAGMGGEAGAEPGLDSGGSSAGEPPLPMGGEPGQAGMPGEPNAGAGGQPPTLPDPELLFTVRDSSVGLVGTAIADQQYPQSVIYTSRSGAQEPVDGTNEVKVVGTDLGLAEGDAIVSFTVLQPEPQNDAIVSFTVLQPEPQNPLYLFSVADGSEGGPATRVDEAVWDSNEEEGDVYFSDGVPGYRFTGEFGDQFGYNGLLTTEVSLGLAPWVGETPPDELRGIFPHDANQELSELYFTTDGSAIGVTGSAVEATPANERGCTLFKSALDGTNSVVFSCAELGLIATDQIDGLLLHGTDTPSELIFSVSRDATGATGTAVESSALNGPDVGATLFRSTGDDTNTVFLGPNDLGMGDNLLWADDIDGIAVVEAPQASVAHVATCNITYDPFDAANGGGLNYLDGTTAIGNNVLVLHGSTASFAARLVAYNATTCALLQQKDMQVTGFSSVRGWMPVPLAGWAAATPLDNVEFLRVESGGTNLMLYTYDAAGAYVKSIPITTLSYTDNIQGAVYDAVGDQLYVLTEAYNEGYRLRLSKFPRPDAAATEINAESTILPLPCTRDARVAGTDPLGNLQLVQLQGDGFQGDNLTYRVCNYSAAGELLPQPYFWTPEVVPEQRGFIAGGTFFLLNTNNGEGPSVIERSVYQPP